MGLTVTIKKESAWKFNTFGSGGLSVGFVAVSGGQVVLDDPSGNATTFTYGGAGGGLSAGLKIPKIGKIQIKTPKGPATGSGGPMAFPSTGALYITDAFKGDELSTSDIQGLCAFVEVGGGIIGGGSGVAMLLDLNGWWLAGIPTTVPLLLGSASAMLLMAGLNVGVQAQVGGAAYLGYMG
jgi:hypothetical protein